MDTVYCQSNDFSAPVPVEIQTRSGGWVAGFSLLRFNDDGTVKVRSDRTGVIRDLPQNAWRDHVPLSL
jgi:hypothetical protein